MIYTINGEEVEYVKIDTKKDKIDIRYYEKFDVVIAHTSRIQRKLRNQKINATVCKDLYHGRLYRHNSYFGNTNECL